MRITCTTCVASLLAALAGAVALTAAAGRADGPTDDAAPGAYHTLRVGDNELRFALILPEHYDAAKTYPVLVALPPGAQDEAMVDAGLELYWRTEAPKRGWIVASPINPSWTKRFEGDPDPIAALMDELLEAQHVEGGKFHLAGVSNGGVAAMSAALRVSQRLASLTVLPGMLPAETSREQLAALEHVPVAMFAGAEDTPWAHGARVAQRRLTAADVPVTVEILPDQGHVLKLSGARLFDLLDSRRPDRDKRNAADEADEP